MKELFCPDQVYFLDGAMGTMLQNAGLSPGDTPEALCLSDPAGIKKIHKAYIDAGSDIIYANTFGANRIKLRDTRYDARELTRAAVTLAREAAGTDARVALDVGPTGMLLRPSGTLSFNDAYDAFAEQMTCAEEAGADLIICETMADLQEARAAVLAAKENTSLPVFATMTFERSGRTFTGCPVSAMAMTLAGLGVSALGINCSLSPEEIYPLAKELSECTALPLIIKANAGLPDPSGNYAVGPAEFAAQMEWFKWLNVQFIGGCCGTTPETIRELKRTFAGYAPSRRTVAAQSALCSASGVVTIDGVRVIGERINPTGKKRLAEALAAGDMDYVMAQAVSQADAGADILDINVGYPGADEAHLMPLVVEAVASVTTLPLQIDSANAEAIEAGLRAFPGKGIINSVNGEAGSLECILPIAKKYGAAVVGLTLGENGLPKTADERVAIARRILEAALENGISKEDVYIDCLTLTVSAEQQQARETLAAVRRVREELGLQTVLGVSNVSFGLPARELVNRTFLSMALENGLTLPILNPSSAAMMDTVRAFSLLSGVPGAPDAFSDFYAGAARPAEPREADGMPLSAAVQKGLREQARQAAEAIDDKDDEMAVIDTILIPALDAAGERFEKGEIFLPQLLSIAGAAQEALEVIKGRMEKKGTNAQDKGTIILATVKGDIHDIGKNIVKAVLQNYGYRIVDLGKDVAPSAVVQAAQAQRAPLVGLSALMTTTLPAMAETIALLRESGVSPKVMVGGAVLTADYAATIGADFYAKDAKASADIAKGIFG